jgi:hypothetical protein
MSKSFGIPSAASFDAYESGLMTDEEVIAFFQQFIDSGHAFTLQGHYGRTAAHLIESGVCTPPKR